MAIYIGTAGWALRTEQQPRFATGPSHLARYATRLNAVEINSSFYKPHRPSTYARWADSVPADFRFAVKVPRTITHEKRLADTGPDLDRFLGECGALGEKLGPLLIQLPPSLMLDEQRVRNFFTELRGRHRGHAILEARHVSWFSQKADALLETFEIARAIADPPAGGEAKPRGKLCYWRLHGSPKIYYSDYSGQRLPAFAAELARSTGQRWCIFDNTALGHALSNALEMQKLLRKA